MWTVVLNPLITVAPVTTTTAAQGTTTTMVAPTTTTTVAPTTTTTVAPTTTTTVAPTTTAVPPTTTTTVPVLSPGYPGRPPVGKVLWGATVGDNESAAYHETACNCVMGLHRIFFQWSHRTGYMIDYARTDVDAGRIPWVSIKTPPWSEMANGTHDAGIDEMLLALEALGGPVWLTVHHEPEGGGAGGNVPDDPSGPAGHVAMNRQVRARMTALDIDNVALANVLMTYTWNSASGRNPEQWWAPGIYDFLGVDHYITNETTPLLDSIWVKVRAFAQAKGVDVAVAEWGLRGTNAIAGQRVHDWYAAAAASTGISRVVALAAFDSNPTGQDPAVNYWKLAGEQLTAFRALLVDPRTMILP